ncbi:MAG: hypothetical protein HQL40_09800 [Alphaproteobacteria bacterium]|nr:hypothetical protein [Alphaproteobacteria bacterium]
MNDALASVLRKTKRAWSVHGVISSENTKTLKNSSGRPDILIQEASISPVVIETEVIPAITVESEARSRLGCHVASTGRPIMASIAVRLPLRLRQMADSELANELDQATDLDYALFTGKDQTNVDRWPLAGWLKGSSKDISILAQTAAVPPALIEDAVNSLVSGVSEAAGILDQIATTNPTALTNIATELCQEDGPQTRRMAATILSDAFVFHETLAGATEQLKSVRSLDQLRSAGELSKTKLLAEWRKILEVNYWPIFDISRRILESVPTVCSKTLVEKLAETADQLVENQLMRSHDLTGAVFQKLISDRKFLAAYYTTPASAALMAGLVLPQNDSLPGGAWGTDASLTSLRIADFACGTGTLLSTVYQRLGQIHELHGGNSEAIHADMMGKVLVGCDVLPAAAHLTASMLSGAHPAMVYKSSHIMTLAYGKQNDGGIALGSIDLLDAQRRAAVLSITAQKIEATGTSQSDTWEDLPHKAFDIVVMNPPFTRATGQEGNKVGVPNPMFAAFSSSEEEQRAMSKATKCLTVDTCYHGNAGEGSIFVALGHRKLKDGGKTGLILPLSMVTGDAWEACRQLFRKSYTDLIVLSVTGLDGGLMSFSADTSMGECMLVAQKKRPKGKDRRAVFVVFDRTPSFPMIGANAAQQITRQLRAGAIAKLEDGPNGGTDICFGDDVIGTMIDAALPENGGWNIARVADMALAQTAHQLTRKDCVWLPTMAEAQAVAIPMTTVEKLGTIGPYHADIHGDATNGAVRGPFKVIEIKKSKVPTYPTLWSHSAKHERTLSFDALQEAVPRVPKEFKEKAVIDRKVAEVWATASYLHFNRDFRFNSQSTAVQFTSSLSLGGRAWLSIKIGPVEHEKIATLWGNCTLGLLTYWYFANKQHAGRGSIGKNQLATLPFLDVAALNPMQIEAGVKVFDDLSAMDLQPLHDLAADANRHELDRRFLVECLGFDPKIVAPGGPLNLLRQKLAAEPSIRGGKS